MRILQFSKHYPPYAGGVETVTYDLTEGLNKLGYRCDVLCANNKFISEVDEIGEYKIWRMASLGKILSTSITPSIISMFRKLSQEYDIIHIHFPDPVSALAIYLVRPKAKIL